MTDIALPPPRIVRNAVLGPLLGAEGSIIRCAADTGIFKLEHLRADTLDGVLDSLVVTPPADPPTLRIDSPAIYGGPFIDHFGHMAAEGIHRLWAATLCEDLRDAPILFQIENSRSPPRHAWLDGLVGMCGVDPGRLAFVNRVVTVKTLHVPKQGRALGGAILIDGYPALFPLGNIPWADSDAARRIYVSRRRHGGQSYAGEARIEAALARAGFDILHAEEMPVAAFLSRLRHAEAIVFAEGSAIHNLELCGPVATKVFVIGRRIGTKRRFGAVLDSTGADWRIFPVAGSAEGEGLVDLDAAAAAMVAFFGLPITLR